MILRSPENGTRLLIPQPSHGFLSGQMMAAWGALSGVRAHETAEACREVEDFWLVVTAKD